MSFWAQVWALVKKDLQVAKANRKSSIFEVIFPLFMGIMCGLFIYLISIIQNGSSEYSNVNPVLPLQVDVGAWVGIVNVAQYPLIVSLISFLHGGKIDAPTFSSEDSMMSAYVAALKDQRINNLTTFLGIVPLNSSSIGLLNSHGSLSPTSSNVALSNLLYDPTNDMTHSIVEKHTDYQDIYVLFNLRAIFSSTGVGFLLDGFIPALIFTAGRLVEEKRMKIRESLKVMGLSDAAYLLSNYISSFMRMAIGTSLISVTLAAFGAITAIQIPPVFGIALLFVASLISFAQIMPSLFSVSIWSNVLCIVLLSGGAALSSISTGWGFGGQVGSCLLSPVAFYYAMMYFLSNGTVILQVSPGLAVGMLVLDTAVYAMIGQYIYSISPGEFGVPKHPLFFIRWIWHHKPSPPPRDKESTISDPLISEVINDSETSNRIILQGLEKYFGDQRHTPAVDKLSLSIRRKEIFALLGHNGAGKTTTISILTGMLTPTNYSRATVDGLDIHEDMDMIRQTVGLCPQFDVLINDLTARQHLEMFAALKGRKNADEAVNHLLKELDLPDTPQRSSTFSGGMKRRLSVGNALVGDASLIFLDEPSSGMDPLSRRQMWDLLRAERDKGKTLVLTTHFMEEADYLGDRIAIMSHGRMYCCDTSAKLKENYGVGYYLSLVKGSQGVAAQVDQAQALLARFIPAITLHHQSSGDATWLLPISGVPQFGEMLRELEEKLSGFGFHSYGLSMNTLEDVFVSISEKEAEVEEEKKKALHPGGSPRAPVQPASLLVGGESPQDLFDRALKVPYWTRVRSHIATVFGRKWLMLRRSRRMQLMVVLFPLFFIALAFATIQPSNATNQAKFNNAAVPDYQNMQFVWLRLRDFDDNAKVKIEMNRVYLENYPNASVVFYDVNSYDDYNSGQFLPMHSVSFIGGFQTPKIPAGFMIHHVDLSGKSNNNVPLCNYTILFSKEYNPGVAAQLVSMFNAAVERAAGNQRVQYVDFQPDFFTDQSTNSSAPPFPVHTSGDDTYNFLQVGIYLCISVVQLVANCVIPVADELQRRIYHTNRAHGMTAVGYFVGNLLFDLMCCIYPFVVTVIAIYVKGIGAFHDPAVAFWVCVAGFLFATHVVLQGYCLVCYFDTLKPITYTGLMHGLNLAMMGTPYILIVSLNAAHLSWLDKVKPFVLSIFPACSFYHILDNASDSTASQSQASNIMTFSQPATAWGFIFLIVELLLPGYLLYRFASGKSVRHLAHRRPDRIDERTTLVPHDDNASVVPMPGTDQPSVATSATVQGEDPDVAAERARVLRGADSMIMTRNLRKTFGFPGYNEKVAVSDLCLGLNKGECFGLLGPNGAGKTTTCKLILKEMEPTLGDVLFPYADSIGTQSRDEEYLHYRLGVCQQGDTLWEFLDAQEHMEQYLRLRLTTAYRQDDWTKYIETTINKVQLADAIFKRAGGFSGGMKRKLIVCLAMYTGAMSVFLDEPSTGMDPFARRALWKVILEALSNDRCVLLTTHSMEEADAVCSRIGIITAGQLQCIGSSQHLKNRFGGGYVLTMVMDDKAANEATIDADVYAAFGPATKLQEAIGTSRRYGIGHLSSLANAFLTVEAKRGDWQVKQYSITQTGSLEQIFLNFVGTAVREDTHS